MRLSNLDALDAWLKKVSPSCNTEEIARDFLSRWIADQLSLYHDSQLSAFFTEEFDWMNQKHNRSSSPFTILAELAERKVANTGAGQPNYWPKTWFGADAYTAVFGTPKSTLRVFRLFCFHKYIWLNRATGDLRRTKVYMPIWCKKEKEGKRI